MPRIRTIKPQFWLDENLGKIPRDARLLYIGLWNLADDTGVFQWRPARIKAQLFPYDADLTPEDITAWLDLLVEAGDVIHYSYGNEDFGYIKSFLEHQTIKKPSQYTFAPLPRGTIEEPLPQDSTGAPPEGYQVGTSGEVVGNQWGTTSEPVPLGNRVLGNRLKGIGNRLKDNRNPAEVDVGLDSEVGKVFTYYEENIGKLTPLVADGIKEWLQDHPPERIIKAIKEAVIHGVKTPAYINAVLENMKNGKVKKDKNNDPEKYLTGQYQSLVER